MSRLKTVMFGHLLKDTPMSILEKKRGVCADWLLSSWEISVVLF